jgi:hypothetical protein
LSFNYRRQNNENFEKIKGEKAMRKKKSKDKDDEEMKS